MRNVSRTTLIILLLWAAVHPALAQNRKPSTSDPFAPIFAEPTPQLPTRVAPPVALETPPQPAPTPKPEPPTPPAVPFDAPVEPTPTPRPEPPTPPAVPFDTPVEPTPTPRPEPPTPPAVPFDTPVEPTPTPRPEPPTPPAVPFDNRPQPTPTPRPEPPTPPAVPFDTPTPRPTPPPAPANYQPVPSEPAQTPAPRLRTEPPTPPAVPFDPASTDPGSFESQAAASESSGEPTIRITPSARSLSPEEAQMEVANSYYIRKNFELAAVEYDNYLRMNPQGKDRQAAFFRLGESYRAIGNVYNARNAYENLLIQFKSGEFVGPTAYRLAEMYFSVEDYRSALPLFEKAGQKVTDPEVRLAAQYREARCLELLDRPESARAAYRSVVAVKDANPYRDASLLALAQISSSTKRKAEALGYYSELAATASKPAMKAEAAVKGGVLALELKDRERARQLLQQALEYKESGEWNGLARLGLLRLSYEDGQYEEVIKNFGGAVGAMPQDVQPEALLLVGNAYRQLGKYDAASRMYDDVLTRFPTSNEAAEAEFQRLISLYSMGDPQLLTRIEDFLVLNPTGVQSDQARLLKGESYYKVGDFANAAAAYDSIPQSELADDLKADAVFKLAWCRMTLGENINAIAAYTRYLGDYPGHAQVPAALAQRGILLQKEGDFAAALADFTLLVDKYPAAPEREIALQQKALIMGQKKDNTGMESTFLQLLKDYPKTEAAAQANYWIGWVRFEDKKYKECIPYFEASRTLDKEGYEKRVGLRMVLAYYYLEQQEPLQKEVNAYLASEPDTALPGEILRWLGLEYFKDGNYEAAAQYLGELTGRENPVPPAADVWLYLGRARTELRQWKEAETAFKGYLGLVNDPRSKAEGYLALALVYIGDKEYDAARSAVDKAQEFQPEGRTNAEARMCGAEIEMAEGKPGDAAKAFLSVSVLYDDMEITPRAMEKASQAYSKAGNDEEAAKVMNQLRTRFPEYQVSQQPEG